MDQQKTGAFLKELRKEKGWTQEELGEKLYTTSRTVSRWETGTNLPDLTVLVELAEIYEVDIREIINGERETGDLSNNINDVLKKAAEYAEEEKAKLQKKSSKNNMCMLWLLMFCILIELLFKEPSIGYLYGLIPENICSIIYYVGNTILLIILAFVLVSVFKIKKQLAKIKNK